MKKLITALLLSASATSAFAADQMTVSGKKVTMSDTRATLIQKFGKPESGTAQFSNWTLGNLSIYASHPSKGLSQFSVTQTGRKSGSPVITTGGKTLQLGKDTIRTATDKLKHGCFSFDEGRQGSTYSMALQPAGQKYYIILETTGDAYDVRTMAGMPITGFTFTKENPESSEGCR